MQRSAQFNYSTAQGDGLFGVSIFSKFEYRDYWNWSNWNLEMLVFVEGGKLEYLEKNPQRRDNKLNPHMVPRPGIESRPHWWEASALTTAPSLLPLPSFSKKIVSNSMEGTTSKSRVLPWAQKWPLLLQTFLWPTLKQIVSQSIVKPSVWKRYIDDIFSLWDTCKHDIERFIWQANSYHPTIKFTAEISNAEASFPYKGNRFHHHSILGIKMDFKRTETFFSIHTFSL